MTIDELNILHDKAKTRKDGVYSFRGNLWAVKDKSFVAYSDFAGNCYLRMGAFNTSIGKVNSWEIKQKLTEWLKGQK